MNILMHLRYEIHTTSRSFWPDTALHIKDDLKHSIIIFNASLPDNEWMPLGVIKGGEVWHYASIGVQFLYFVSQNKVHLGFLHNKSFHGVNIFLTVIN